MRNARRMQGASLALVACLSVGLSAGLSTALAQAAPPGNLQSSPVDAAFLAGLKIQQGGTLVDARQVQDVMGRHVLVLTRTVGPSREQSGAREGRIDLRATYYDEQPSGWQEAWTIKDFVDCPDLDMMGRFLLKGLSVTDLDRNGVAEVTVPYMTFCGGGVDPGVLKIILRQGATKFALRGENEIPIPGYASDGGRYTPDKDLLLPGNAVFMRHLDKVWQQVKVVKLE